MSKTIKIGTRGSKLALVQANMAAAQLMVAHPDLCVEIVEINTSGDWKPEHGETRLSEAEGGKGLFAKEIERAIMDGTVDCGVHSMKDMPSFLPDGLVIDHILERADSRDAFLSDKYGSLNDLPEGAKVGRTTCPLNNGKLYKTFTFDLAEFKKWFCLLYTSPSPRDRQKSRMPSSA